MQISFRYVEQAFDSSVTLFLHYTPFGLPRGTVTGPVQKHCNDDEQIVEVAGPLPLDRAFPSAIRMANRNDVEIVVTGERALWNPNWGQLQASA